MRTSRTERSGRCRRILVALTLVSAPGLLGPSQAQAQIRPQATPFTTEGCAQYQVTRPPNGGVKVDAGALKTCIEALRKAIAESPAETDAKALAASNPADASLQNIPAVTSAIERGAEATAPGSTEAQKHFQLKKIYLAYTNIRLWERCAQKRQQEDVRDANASATASRDKCGSTTTLTASEAAALQDEFGRFSEQLNLALKGHGIAQPFAATLVTGFAFVAADDAADTGKPTDAPSKEGVDAAGASGAGFITFESLHFFSHPNRAFDIDLTGTLGVRPALAILEPESDQSIRVAQYKQAFVWSFAVEPNFRVADLAEVSAFVGGGQTILNSTQSLVENGSNSQVAMVSGGDAGATFLEFGTKLSIFAETLDLLHLSKGLLSPMLGFSFGYRKDERFKAIILPDDLGNPRDRLFVRLSTSAIPLTDPSRTDKPFTLTFSLEHEWARRGGSAAVPHGTRVLIRGDLDLFKAADGK